MSFYLSHNGFDNSYKLIQNSYLLLYILHYYLFSLISAHLSWGVERVNISNWSEFNK